MKVFVKYFIFIVLSLSYASWGNASSYVMNSSIRLERGNELYMEQEYTSALNEYTLAMKQSLEENNTDTYLKSLSCIATIYDVFNNYPRALYYYNKVLNTIDREKNKELYSSTIAKMVVCYCNANDIRNAKKFLELQKKYPQSDKRKHTYLLLINRGLIASKERQTDNAITIYKQAIQFVCKNMMDGIYAAPIFNEIGVGYMDECKYDSALTYYKECETIAERQHLYGYLSDVYQSLSECYMKMGHEKLAEYYKDKYQEIADSTFSRGKINTVSNRLLMTQEEESDKKMMRLADTVNLQFLVIMIFAVLVACLACAICIILRLHRKQMSSYKLLIHKDEEIEALSIPHTAKAINNLSAQQADELIKRISDVLGNDEMVFDSEFSLVRLSQEVGSNTKYVSMVINETYKKNFKTLLNERRIREATRRLRSNGKYKDATMQTIALSLGYSSATSFIIAFKKIIGMTPAVYKNIKKNSDGEASDYCE